MRGKTYFSCINLYEIITLFLFSFNVFVIQQTLLLYTSMWLPISFTVETYLTAAAETTEMFKVLAV